MTGTAGDKNTPALIRVFGRDAESDECAGYVFPAIPQSTNGEGTSGGLDERASPVLLQGREEHDFPDGPLTG